MSRSDIPVTPAQIAEHLGTPSAIALFCAEIFEHLNFHGYASRLYSLRERAVGDLDPSKCDRLPWHASEDLSLIYAADGDVVANVFPSAEAGANIEMIVDAVNHIGDERGGGDARKVFVYLTDLLSDGADKAVMICRRGGDFYASAAVDGESCREQKGDTIEQVVRMAGWAVQRRNSDPDYILPMGGTPRAEAALEEMLNPPTTPA